jgi:hypothetical protein
MKPEAYTPLGAAIYVRRGRGKEVIVTVDRWPIEDATGAQCAAVHRFAVEEIKSTVKPNTAVGFLAQPSIWTIPTTKERELYVIIRLIAIEAGWDF